MVKQLNVFIDNRPGRVSRVTEIMSTNAINIRAFTIQDRGSNGLMKMIVDRPEDARLALADNNFACALKDVVAVSIPDEPGNLHKLTTIMYENNVNIADVFGFVIQPDSIGVCCMEIHDTIKKEALEKLKEEGFTLLTNSDLAEL